MRHDPVRASLLVQVLGLCVAASTAAAQDHPLIVPYEGSKLHSKQAKEFDQYEIMLGPRWGSNFGRSRKLEGRVTRLEYRTAPERSALEVFRNYEAALAKTGFEPLYSCVGYGKAPENCGDMGGHYLATKLPRPEGDVYIALSVGGYQTGIVIVELRPMEGGKVRISAEARQPAPGTHARKAA